MTTAAEFIAGFEGFARRAYWDVNAWRLGFGSDTEGPEQRTVTPGMETTRDRALQNLALRIPKFQSAAIHGRNGMGETTWQGLTENQKTAITSIVYNYGHLPIRVDANDPEGTANAIRGLQNANAGVNRKRRLAEATFYLHGDGAPKPAPQPPAPLPSIPAGPAGRNAALREHIGASIDALAKEQVRIEAEIGILKVAIESLAALDNVMPVQSRAVEPTAERKDKVFGKNWQTSISGIGALLGAAASVAHSISLGEMPDVTEMGIIFATVSAGIGLLQAKDKNVTGGSVPATQEAERRLGRR